MQESRLFATAIEALLDGVVIVDAETASPGPRILFVNTAFTRLTGLAPLDVLGQDLCAFVNPHFDPAMLGRLRESLAAGHPFAAETTARPGEGAALTLAWSLTPVRDPGGRLTRGIIVLRDVTDLRRTERLLLQVQKIDSIGLLSSGVVHDFNNQLTIIRGSSELASMESSASPALHTLLQQIITTADHAAALTRQLLHYSRHQPAAFEAVDLNAAVAQLAKMLHRLLDENIEFEVRLAPTLPHILADPAMLEQVIVNLVINARDALSGGAGRIVIETEDVFLPRAHTPRQRPGRHVRLVVRDTGRGIPPSQLAHIFEPFFTTKPEGRGTGLGLSTVQSVAQQHQGWIDVESTPGHGSAFSVFFPARPDLDTPPPTATDTSLPRGGDETILLVEDDVIVRTVTSQILRQFGYNVTAVRTGPEALRAVSTGLTRPDLLLADQVLPEGLYGRDVVDALRSGRRQLPAIIMSGHTPHENDLEWFRTHRTPFLPKPFSAITLAGVVRATLDNEPAPAGADEAG